MLLGGRLRRFRYSDAGQTVIGSGRDALPHGIEAWLGAVSLAIGQPERYVEWCRAQLARGHDTHTLTRSSLVLALTFAGCGEEAWAAANGLIEAAEATHNPFVLANALRAYGWAYRDADPAGALEALRRGLVIAQDSGNRLLESHVPSGGEGWMGGAYLAIGQPERWVEWCRARLACGGDPHGIIRACLVFALTTAGSGEEAMAATDGLIDAAEATDNPYVLSFVHLADGFAFRDSHPVRALDALRRGLVISQDSGNRFNESHLAVVLSRLEAQHGDRMAALDYVTLAIRNYDDSGNATTMRSPLAVLAALLDRLGRHEAAATIAGFAAQPFLRSRRSLSSGARSPTCATSSVTRSTNRSPARAKRRPPPPW